MICRESLSVNSEKVEHMFETVASLLYVRRVQLVSAGCALATRGKGPSTTEPRTGVIIAQRQLSARVKSGAVTLNEPVSLSMCDKPVYSHL